MIEDINEFLDSNSKTIFHITESSFSFLRSILKPKSIVDLAKKMGMESVCLADDSNLFGSLEFNLAAAKAGIKPINGVRTKLLINGEFLDVILLAKDHYGYQNLVRLTSYIHLYNINSQFEKHITFDQLNSFNQGIILISSYINAEKYLKNQDNLILLNKIFENRIYLEISRHNINKDSKIEAAYLDLSTQIGMPVLATNKVLFGQIGDFEAHDVLLCIADRNSKSDPNRRTSNNQYYFKSPKEMIDAFKDIPVALANNIWLNQRCNFMLHEMPPLLPSFNSNLTNNFPNTADSLFIEVGDSSVNIVEEDVSCINLTEEDVLKQKSYLGLLDRLNYKSRLQQGVLQGGIEVDHRVFLGTNDDLDVKLLEAKYPAYFQRLEYELGVICNMKFAGYFLIVSDFVQWSKNNSVAVGPGRGSGAGAIVAWCLGITELDPIEYGLIFERFLNPDRVSMPDFDIDFCQQNRQKVIDYVVDKYGKDRVAQIITFGTLQAKAVIKDVGRALNLPFRYANRLTELIPFNAVAPVTLKQAVEEVNELKLAYKGLGLYSSNNDSDDKDDSLEMNRLMQEVLEYALMLEGLHRHASIHAAGIVISGEELIKKVALYKEDIEDMAVIQASLKYAEKLGLVKFDFLGLQTLTLIAEVVKTIKNTQNIDIAINSIPLNDRKTYKMLSSADAIGVFQLEGGMVKVLKQVKPDSVRDIMALTALYRPGPMDNIHIYIKCKHGEQKPSYLHEKMKPVLEETYGVIVYQEQVIELVKVLAGYSLSGADNLRRAMGKKDKREMDMHRSTFIEGCSTNKIDEKLSAEIFDSIEKFAGYGFNKAHAASYALISYQTAYLKANFTIEFIVSFLNLELHDHVKISSLINYAKKIGLRVNKPCINNSEVLFTIVSDSSGNNRIINYGLGAVKSLGLKVLEDIVLCRGGERFIDIFDFVRRGSSVKNFSKKTLEGLIKSGALDQLNANRHTLMENLGFLLEILDKYKKDNESNQFNLLNFDQINQQELKIFEEWDEIPKLRFEFDFLGSFVEDHPIGIYRKNFNLQKISTLAMIKNMKLGNHKITLAGFIEAKYAKKSPKGKYINLKLSDETDIFEVTIFDEKMLESGVDLLQEKALIVLECDLNLNDGAYKLTAKKITSIDDICSNLLNKIEVNLEIESSAQLEEVTCYLNNLKIGSSKVTFYIKSELLYYKVAIDKKFELSPQDVIFLKKFKYKNCEI